VYTKCSPKGINSHNHY